MDCVKIAGRVYDVIVESITESFDITHSENAGRTISLGARMSLAPLGTFIGHEVTFRRVPGKESEYDALYTMLYQPRYDGIDIEIVHNQSTIAYEAYVSTGRRALLRRDEKTGKTYWGEMTIKFTPMEAQVLPL